MSERMQKSGEPEIDTRASPVREGGLSSRMRRRAYELVEGTQEEDAWAHAFEVFIVILILLNVAAFAASTVASLETAYGSYFSWFEAFSVAVFTVEYAVRIWTAVEVPFLKSMPAWRARMNWAARPYLVIDLLAILPFYLHQMIGLDLRIVRVLRLLRFLKLSRYSPAIDSLVRVIYGERRALLGAGLLLLAAVMFAATGIYYIERDVQPDKFGSVPEAAWWAIATLTTVGYGDVAPVTGAGKAFGAVVMVIGLCVLALPVAIISSGFAREVGNRDFVVTWSMMSRIPLLTELDHAQVAKVMPLFHAHNLPPGIELIERGAPGVALYFIASGQVELTTPELTRIYTTGEAFGVVALVNHDVSHGAFRTVTRCRLLKLYREDFHRLEHANSKLARAIRQIARQRVSEREKAILLKAEAAARKVVEQGSGDEGSSVG